MSNNNTSIHDFDFSLICDYFSGLERQGPGSEKATIKALGFIDALTSESHIADIGCGTGGQTRVLAQQIPSKIVGIDLFANFIEQFNVNAAKHHLDDRIVGKIGTMEDLPFEEESLDCIWSEGAIYNIGFKRGIQEWRKFLKKGGYLAVTEASWFTKERPDEIENFWNNAYPEIDTISQKIDQLEDAGYIPVATFILPEECWIDQFYLPQISLQKHFLNLHRGNKTVESLIENQRHEAELYQTYKEFYGYAFYIARKR